MAKILHYNLLNSCLIQSENILKPKKACHKKTHHIKTNAVVVKLHEFVLHGISISITLFPKGACISSQGEFEIYIWQSGENSCPNAKWQTTNNHKKK